MLKSSLPRRASTLGEPPARSTLVVSTPNQRPIAPAFTLVELLVVIGLIAILMSLVLPLASTARRQANSAACAAQLRSLGYALQSYAVEHQSFPWGTYYRQFGSGLNLALRDAADSPLDDIAYTWWSVIAGYMRGKGSPAEVSMSPDGGGVTSRFREGFNCPSGQDRERGCDFACNPVIMPWEFTEVLSSRDRHPLNWRISKPSKAHLVYSDNILLFDACELGNVDPPYSRQYVVGFELDRGNFSKPKVPRQRYRQVAEMYDGHPDFGNSFPIDPGPNDDSGLGAAQGNIRWRHGREDTANFLFADGSVRSLKKTLAYGTPAVRGEVERRFFRPKNPPGYSLINF